MHNEMSQLLSIPDVDKLVSKIKICHSKLVSNHVTCATLKSPVSTRVTQKFCVIFVMRQFCEGHESDESHHDAELAWYSSSAIHRTYFFG